MSLIRPTAHSVCFSGKLVLSSCTARSGVPAGCQAGTAGAESRAGPLPEGAGRVCRQTRDTECEGQLGMQTVQGRKDRNACLFGSFRISQMMAGSAKVVGPKASAPINPMMSAQQGHEGNTPCSNVQHAYAVLL